MAERLNGTEIHVYELPGEVRARCLCGQNKFSFNYGAEGLNG